VLWRETVYYISPPQIISFSIKPVQLSKRRIFWWNGFGFVWRERGGVQYSVAHCIPPFVRKMQLTGPKTWNRIRLIINKNRLNIFLSRSFVFFPQVNRHSFKRSKIKRDCWTTPVRIWSTRPCKLWRHRLGRRHTVKDRRAAKGFLEKCSWAVCRRTSTKVCIVCRWACGAKRVNNIVPYVLVDI